MKEDSLATPQSEIPKEMPQIASFTQAPPDKRKVKFILIVSIILALIIGVICGYFIYPFMNKTDTIIKDESTNNDTGVVTKDTIPTENQQPSITPNETEAQFCKEYGTSTIPKNELLEEYITGPGDTIRDIAKNKQGDETKAIELIDANSILRQYEVDDVLPMRLKIYIPNDKYNIPDITSYIRSKGNISYNKDKPMFGVNAPNSGTGPFIINDNIKDDIENIKDGDCVVVIYGSKGYDPQKVVMEVTKQ